CVRSGPLTFGAVMGIPAAFRPRPAGRRRTSVALAKSRRRPHLPAMPEPTRRIPTRAVASWILYDLANTIFSMGVVSLYFSLYVRDAVGERRADSAYGVITAISMGIIFVISPLLGAMTDRARRRMPF